MLKLKLNKLLSKIVRLLFKLDESEEIKAPVSEKDDEKDNLNESADDENDKEDNEEDNEEESIYLILI